jgi:hypothetical protein
MSSQWLFARVGELAERLGFTMDVDPYLGEFARLRFADGGVRYMSPSAFDLNPGTSSELARMPALFMQFLSAAGLPVPAFEWISADAGAAIPEQASRIAARLGYPLILRSSGRQGVGPYLATDAEVLGDLAAQVLRHAPALLLQQPVWGPHVTVIVLGEEAHVAFERVPWRIVGDGMRSVQHLLTEDRERNSAITLAMDDWRIDDMLEFGRRTRATVPAAGEPVQVALKPSPEYGGSVRALAGGVPPELAELACRVMRASGLVFGGVEFILDARGAWVLDVHAAPDLEAYEALGWEARRHVSDLLENVIRASR